VSTTDPDVTYCAAIVVSVYYAHFEPSLADGWFPGGSFIRCDVFAPNPYFDDTLPPIPPNFPFVLQPRALIPPVTHPFNADPPDTADPLARSASSGP
jgi:hypothetical protein